MPVRKKIMHLKVNVLRIPTITLNNLLLKPPAHIIKQKMLLSLLSPVTRKKKMPKKTKILTKKLPVLQAKKEMRQLQRLSEHRFLDRLFSAL